MSVQHVPAIALAAMIATHADAGCLEYPERVTLSGRLQWRTFPGAPNYESISRGDAPERVPILFVDRPFCVHADPASGGLDEAASDVREVQIATNRTRFPAKARRGFSVSGFLFMAHTGHHHTRILIGDFR